MEYIIKKKCEASAFMTDETYKTTGDKEIEILVINRNNFTALGKFNGCLIAMFQPQIFLEEDENGSEQKFISYQQAIYLLNDEKYYFDYLNKYATKDMSDIDCVYVLKKQNFRIIIMIYELIVALWKSSC